MNLATLQAFVNTADLNAGTDELADLPGITRWAAGAGLTGTAFDEADRERVVAFREALRGLLLGQARRSRRRSTRRPRSSLSRLAPAGTAWLRPRAA